MSRRAFAIVAAMLLSIVFSWILTPARSSGRLGGIDLDALIPREFGTWIEVPALLAHVDLAVRRNELDQATQLYDDVLSRTYRGPAGERVMLSIAYGMRQRQELKIHRPELCYSSQGYEVGSISKETIELGNANTSLPVMVFLASAPGRKEHVVYWIRVGNSLMDSAMSTRMKILQEGFAGRVPDGILVRASTIIEPGQHASGPRATVEAFIKALIGSLSPIELAALVPTAP